MTEPVTYRVGLPNGATWIYTNKVKAENAALIARAMAAMPSKPNKYNGHIGKYGQQSALAAALGYFFSSTANHAGKPNHHCIYNLLAHGYLPRSPERLQKLRDIAATMPDDWFEQENISTGEEAAGSGHAF